MILKSQTQPLKNPTPPKPVMRKLSLDEMIALREDLNTTEGHVGKLPANSDTNQINGAKKSTPTRQMVLRAVVDGHCYRSEIEKATGLSGSCILDYVRRMRKAGWLKTQKGPNLEMKITPTKRGIEEAGNL